MSLLLIYLLFLSPMTPLWLHKASHLFACVIEVIRSDITVYHLRAQVMITNNVSLVARLVTGFVLFRCCLADLGRLNGRAVCEVICDKMRHMLSHLYKPAAAQLFLFEYFTFMWVELGRVSPWNMDSNSEKMSSSIETRSSKPQTAVSGGVPVSSFC